MTEKTFWNQIKDYEEVKVAPWCNCLDSTFCDEKLKLKLKANTERGSHEMKKRSGGARNF